MKRLLSSLVFAGVFAAFAVPASADPGADAYKKKCAKCHGDDGKGATKMGQKLKVRDLSTADIQSKSDADLIKQVTDGNKAKKMPAYKGKLSEDEIKAVVKFVRGFKK